MACAALAGGHGRGVRASCRVLSPCNEGKPWWEKRGLVTDLAYWIFVPIFTRYLRIWVTVCLTIWIFHISDGQKIADFYRHGHGPVSRLPLWLQGIGYLVATDFALYWIHRGFHRGILWKYHAVHHASKDVEWISAARFHPVNLALGTAAVDVRRPAVPASRPDIFLVVGPFNIITSCLVHANLNWTFGPLRYVFVSPVFHRWHHARDRARQEFRQHLLDLGRDVRHLPICRPARCPAAMASTMRQCPKACARRWSIRWCSVTSRARCRAVRPRPEAIPR